MALLSKIRLASKDVGASDHDIKAIRSALVVSQIDREAEPSFVVIDRRPLIGQCFVASLREARPNLTFKNFPSVEAWQDTAVTTSASTVLLCLPGGSTPQAEQDQISRELAEIHTYTPEVQVAVMSDCESFGQIIQTLKLGIKGYIPTSSSLDIAVQALQLVRAGGVYIPAACMINVVAEIARVPDQVAKEHMFSPRQLCVARALRKGTPNKVIAYELSMCESTVKVHVRNIMKKLKAKNRTEVAYLTNQYFNKEQ